MKKILTLLAFAGISFFANATKTASEPEQPTCPCQINYYCPGGTIVISPFATYADAAAYLASHPPSMICP